MCPLIHIHSVSPCSVILSVPAGVDMVLAYGAPEEAFAAVAAGGTVVFPGGFVPADGTVAVDPIGTRQAWLCWHVV